MVVCFEGGEGIGYMAVQPGLWSGGIIGTPGNPHFPFLFPSTWNEVAFFVSSRGAHHASVTIPGPGLGRGEWGRGAAGCVTDLRGRASWQSEAKEYDKVTLHNKP